MSCEKGCYEATVESCNDIIIKAGLTASAAFYWLMQKPGSSNLYQRLVNTNAEGDLTILKADLPPGYLIAGGFYNIKIRSGANYMEPVALDFGGVEYECILVKIVTVHRDEDDNSEVNVIELLAPAVT